ncbi:glycosyltransferase family 4 protein [Ruegeria sediminis]|uniref:Glycosyltransferase family 4 protein n=1 Tax=Ruegeria sediminis TaxID=2583820 RepID=A0ABY2X4L5_9RHOB|nr:glycosyltransferase family 4 protein [Ruegeria sediminis]TMV10339.1 glycosyltransferase family 4 protein [Ruegeria sediminis]
MTTSIAFVTTGDIESIATSKRAFGMASPLAGLNYEVSILLEDTPNNRARLALEAPTARALWFDRGSASSELRTKRRILRELAPNIVYVGAYGVRNLVLPLAPTRAFYIVEHSELLSAIANRSMVRRVSDAVLERSSLRFFDGQVCASEYLVDFVKARLRAKAVRRVHYSPYAFTRSVLTPGGAPAPGTAGQTILYMGTLARNYGILHILDAVAQLKETRPGVRLVVLGRGRDYETAVAHARIKGIEDNVDFKGYVPESELPEQLSSADVFIAPLFDTIQDIARCPSKMFMYLPFGKPVVTSPIGEACALFGPDYDFYFKPNDVASMRDRLMAALDRPGDWTPNWTARDHEWQARATAFDTWLRGLGVVSAPHPAGEETQYQ